MQYFFLYILLWPLILCASKEEAIEALAQPTQHHHQEKTPEEKPFLCHDEYGQLLQLSAADITLMENRVKGTRIWLERLAQIKPSENEEQCFAPHDYPNDFKNYSNRISTITCHLASFYPFLNVIVNKWLGQAPQDADKIVDEHQKNLDLFARFYFQMLYYDRGRKIVAQYLKILADKIDQEKENFKKICPDNPLLVQKADVDKTKAKIYDIDGKAHYLDEMEKGALLSLWSNYKNYLLKVNKLINSHVEEVKINKGDTSFKSITKQDTIHPLLQQLESKRDVYKRYYFTASEVNEWVIPTSPIIHGLGELNKIITAITKLNIPKSNLNNKSQELQQKATQFGMYLLTNNVLENQLTLLRGIAQRLETVALEQNVEAAKEKLPEPKKKNETAVNLNHKTKK